MKFSTFIKHNMDATVADWEAFARTLPSAQTMSTLALRDHSREILLAIAEGMGARQTDPQRAARSRDMTPAEGSATTAAAEHGALRQMAGFDLVQLFAETRPVGSRQAARRAAHPTCVARNEPPHHRSARVDANAAGRGYPDCPGILRSRAGL